MKTLQPKLRFSEFSEDWVRKKLGDIFTITSASRVHKNEWTDNGVRFFRSSDVVSHFKGTNNTKAYISYELYESLTNKIGCVKKDDILITGGGSIGIPYLIEDNEPLYFKDADLLWIKNVDQIKGFFLYSFFQTNTFKNYLNSISHVGTIAHYTVIQARNTPFSYPSLKEQTKIANFLSSVDEKLNLLKEKKELLEDYKKGIMQKIFNQEIRFKDDNGNDFEDWDNKTLGECLSFEQPTKYLVNSTEYNDNFATPVLTAGKTFILGYTDEVNGIFKKEDLPVIIFDDFTTATQFVDFPFKAKSSAMKILKAKENINIKFVYEAMQNLKFEVGGHGRHWISIYSNLYIDLPSLSEQTKIANFLSAIDRKIELVSNQIQDTQEYKKGLLQQMFV